MSGPDVGPVEAGPWPEALEARVLDPPRVHGYDIEGDVCASYRFTDAVYLAVTGELPDDTQSRLFDLACHFAAVMSAGDAGPHAASLARLCAAGDNAVVASAAVVLADAARALVDAHAPLLAWLASGGGPAPDGFSASPPAAGAITAALERAGLDARGVHPGLTRDAALVATFFASGVRTAEGLVAVLTWARVPFAAAEAFAVRPKAFAKYPMRVPAFTYEGRAR